ncbi:hypothetical protein BH10CHL1_BH10CHL1_24350 [soil metagenome]
MVNKGILDIVDAATQKNSEVILQLGKDISEKIARVLRSRLESQVTPTDELAKISELVEQGEKFSQAYDKELLNARSVMQTEKFKEAMIERFLPAVIMLAEAVGNQPPEEFKAMGQWLESALPPQEPTVGMLKKEEPKTKTSPDKPPIPGTDNYTWDDVFDWYYRQPRKITNDEMAELMSKSKRTIERAKSNYESEYGKRAMPDDKSKFST